MRCDWSRAGCEWHCVPLLRSIDTEHVLVAARNFHLRGRFSELRLLPSEPTEMSPGLAGLMRICPWIVEPTLCRWDVERPLPCANKYLPRLAFCNIAESFRLEDTLCRAIDVERAAIP